MNKNICNADKGKWFVRKSDNQIIGTSLDLGTADSIENYEEKEYTPEEYKSFCEKYGVPIPETKEPEPALSNESKD